MRHVSTVRRGPVQSLPALVVFDGARVPERGQALAGPPAELPGRILHDLPRHGERVLARKPAKKNRSSAGRVGASVNVPYASACLLISWKLHRHEADRGRRRNPLDDLS